MLKIDIPSSKLYNEETEEFFTLQGETLTLEHSLVSLSKWESIWCKPFLTKEKKTKAETISYIKCMTITQNVNPLVYLAIDSKLIKQIDEYIEHPMTATTFAKKDEKRVLNREIITAEIIYYWMIALNIPFECQKWHLNKLLTLINVCNIKNQPKKKMSQREVMARNRALNEIRKQKLNTPG